MNKGSWNQWLDDFRLRLSGLEALPQLSVLAILVGLLAGAVIVAFRFLVEYSQAAFLPGGEVENYEALGIFYRLLLPAGGGLAIGIAWQYLKPDTRHVGIVHVMERMAYHQGRLPMGNAVAEFFGAALSIISGHSVGREGPCVHLGAASGSQLGKWLHLPNNSTRTLVACGTSAAIAASFNTPLAGVIFAMEVVMMEYTLASFAPIILAAVTATTLSRAVFGSSPAFIIPGLELGSLLELPYVLLMGIVLGTLAATFIYLLRRSITILADWPIWLRCTLGGLVVGVLAMAVPEVMGIGYDTVNEALLGQLGLILLLSITAAKLFATAIGLGLGLPGGLIGPTLVIGATAGGAMGILADAWLPGEYSSPAFYAMIGMGTMMGATLQAPLAALTAMLELTANHNIILPGMLALITGGMVSREVFKMESVYIMLMRVQGLDYRSNPLTQTLQRIGVASVMERRIETLPGTVERERINQALVNVPRWIIITEGNDPVSAMPAVDLARYLFENQDAESVNLGDIPAERREIAAIDFQATLQEALTLLNTSGADALYVVRRTIPGLSRIYGIITRGDIDRSYKLA